VRVLAAQVQVQVRQQWKSWLAVTRGRERAGKKEDQRVSQWSASRSDSRSSALVPAARRRAFASPRPSACPASAPLCFFLPSAQTQALRQRFLVFWHLSWSAAAAAAGLCLGRLCCSALLTRDHEHAHLVDTRASPSRTHGRHPSPPGSVPLSLLRSSAVRPRAAAAAESNHSPLPPRCCASCTDPRDPRKQLPWLPALHAPASSRP
jgi:hypothetical protein